MVGFVGMETATHQEYGAKAVIVTTGTALRGKYHWRSQVFSGLIMSLASINLADNLKAARIRNWTFQNRDATSWASSINYDETNFNLGMKLNHFSYTSRDELCKDQVPCWLT